MLVMAYDVDRIILGGGVSQAGETLLQPILREWQRQSQESTLAAQLLKPDLLHLLPPNFNAGVWGGIVLAAQQKEVTIETHMPLI
jgi:predicted NBD/HSP70 family sugar kinase